MRLRHLLPAIAATALALTACSSGSHTRTPAITIRSSTPKPTPTATASDDMTQLVVDLSWAQQTDDDKDAMCLGIQLGGPEWAAEQMRAGAGDESVDWDRAAQLVEAKCADR